MTKLKDSRTIEQISYLSDGVRKVLEATPNGTFKHRWVEGTDRGKKIVSKELTAREIINHPDVMGSDPVITLKSGDKVRVFVAGDPSYLPAIVDGILEKNDKFEVLRRKFLKQKKERESARKKKQEKIKFDTDEYESPFWGLDDYHD